MRIGTLGIATVFLLIAPRICAQNFTRLASASETTIDNIVNTKMTSNNTVGCAVGVVLGGDIVYLKGYGYANKELQEEVTPNTVFRIASISKTITAIAALQLEEDNKLDIGKDIRDQSILGNAWPLKYYNGTTAVVNSEHLIACRSGISNFKTGANSDEHYIYTANNMWDYDPIAAIDLYKNDALEQVPGTKYTYSTQGFDLLGAVIEKVGNAPYEQQVFDRIGARNKADMPFLYPAITARAPYYNATTRYEPSGGNMVRVYEEYVFNANPSMFLAGGGWMASARDLTHFIKAVYDKVLINSSTTTFLTTVQGDNYCAGIIKYGNTDNYFHDGVLKPDGTRSFYFINMSTGNGVVVITNTEESGHTPSEIAVAVMAQYGNLTKSGSAYSNPIPNSFSAPTITTPANGATGTNTTVKLEWDAIDFANGYEYEYATNASFTSSTKDTAHFDSVYLSELSPNTTYYYRIRAVNEYLYGGTTGSWSTTRNFTTGVAKHQDVLPFEETFESFHSQSYGNEAHWVTGPGYKWSFERTNRNGRMRIGANAITQVNGNGAVTLDALGTRNQSSLSEYNSNYLILTLDLAEYSGVDDLSLSFDYIHHGGTSTSGNNKVWIRGDNTQNWVTIYDWYANKVTAGSTKSVVGLDIDAALSNANQTPTSTFQIRFGQNGNFFAKRDGNGITIDNVKVEGHKTVTWTGTASTAYNDAGNWSSGQIPDKRHNVVIPANVSNNPILRTSEEVRDLTINSGAYLLFLAFGGGAPNLTVYGNYANNGDVNTLCTSCNITFKGAGAQTLNHNTTNAANNLVVDNANGITLTGHSKIKDLTLTNGHVDVGSYNLIIEGNTSHGNSNSYIRISDSGKVKVEVGANPVILPVGRNPYLPVIIDDGGGAEFTVGVSDGIYKNPESSSTLQSSDAVSETWIITADANVTGVTVQVGWDAGEEMTGFDGANSNLAYWETGVSQRWNTNTFSAATGSGPYYQTRTLNFNQNVLYYFGVGSASGALPVELTHFEANWMEVGKTAQLRWGTAMELNNSHFSIERSYTGTEWESIGEVEGHGTSMSEQVYHFTDYNALAFKNPDQSTVFYRLKQVDFNGDFEYSEVRSVSKGSESIGNSPSFSIYPNPATNVLHASIPDVYTILDLTGKVVLPPQHTREILLDALPKGMYILRDSDGNTKRFIKE